MGARAVATGVGLALGRIPETDDETTARASLRASGRLLAAGAAGSAIFETGMETRNLFPPKSGLRPIVMSMAGFAGAMYYAKDLLAERESVIQPWSADDKRAALPASIGIGLAIPATGRGIGSAFVASRRTTVRYFGEDAGHAAIGRAMNATVWAIGGTAFYLGVVSLIARSNEKIEPAYSTPPDNPHVSASPKSISPFDELGLQGRRFVTDVMTPDLIESTMGEKAIAHPIRCFVEVNSDPLYPSGRSEMMLDEDGAPRSFRPVLPVAVLSNRHWVGRSDDDRGHGAVRARRCRNSLYPIRTRSLVPRSAEGRLGSNSISRAFVGREDEARRNARETASEGRDLRREPRSVGVFRGCDVSGYRMVRPLRN